MQEPQFLEVRSQRISSSPTSVAYSECRVALEVDEAVFERKGEHLEAAESTEFSAGLLSTARN